MVSIINFDQFLSSGDRANFKKIEPNDAIYHPTKTF